MNPEQLDKAIAKHVSEQWKVFVQKGRGFTGYDADKPTEIPPRDWLMDVNKRDHCVVLVEEILEH